MAESRKLRVFLCHASQDKPVVRELYQKLSAEGWIDPWLDEEKLLPGQDWDMEIEKVVEGADAVVVCLSGNSVTKEGYVQHELRMILNMADYKPEGTLFIIPIRLDECPLPRRLKMWHTVDSFPESRREWAYGRLTASLQVRAAEIAQKEQKKREANETSQREIEEVRQRAESAAVEARQQTEERDRKELEEHIRKEMEARIRAEYEAREKTRQESDTKKQKIQPVEKTDETSPPLPARKEDVFKKDNENLDWPKNLGTSQSEVPVRGTLADKLKALGVVAGVKANTDVDDGLDWPNRMGTPSNSASFSPKPTPFKKTPGEQDIYLFGDMEFVKIPAGKFLMGSADSDKQAYDDEKPQHNVDIPYDYWLARFPVTNAQYARYVKAAGGNHPVSDWQKKKDHPVTQISWNDALAYYRWLENLLRGQLPPKYVLRLPTEAEWEKAASWKPSPDDRGQIKGETLIYPWSNSFDKNRCNTSESNVGGTTPVGQYSPQGDSPFGCADMSGNVWEWTHSLFKPYPYLAGDGREDEKADGNRVLRGGSWTNVLGGARCGCRLAAPFESIRNYRGFRVVVSPALL
jgi:formylglycine-generating enzyme required for sulfatase activity